MGSICQCPEADLINTDIMTSKYFYKKDSNCPEATSLIKSANRDVHRGSFTKEMNYSIVHNGLFTFKADNLEVSSCSINDCKFTIDYIIYKKSSK